LRPDAADTLAYFAAQGVTVRVVSGDSAATVSAVAAQVGLPRAAEPVDARSWPDDPEALDTLIASHTVFGRVTPEQKRAMVDSLRRQGHVIAMTGDGVNDTLALKDADLGIAMGSGSPVTRGVAQLVLLNDQFETLPSVVAEGRQVLHNIERVSSLFLVKNTYSLIISVVVAIAGWPYPFLPRHLSLISAVAIGIPGFFLALSPSEERFRPGFLRRTLRFSVTAGTITSAAVLSTYAIGRQQSAPGVEARTGAVIVLTFVSLWVLALAARPWQLWKAALILAMAGLFIAAFTVPGVKTFFNLEHPPNALITFEAVVIGAIACVLISVATRVVEARARAS
ncbi:MAG: HAD-IC family P-type ATPase, partial [Acidimicrobiaceae bacterium]|nr:HAD-IC family P-type ATPase [Acidimicrobiaceae bacterium]